MPGGAFWRRRVAACGKGVWFWRPLLVSSWRRRVYPPGFRQSFNPSATVTRRIRRRGERAISRQTIAQGMSECSACTCMLVCVFLCTLLHTRPRVQQAPGIPCALLLSGRMILQTSDASRRENAELHLKCRRFSFSQTQKKSPARYRADRVVHAGAERDDSEQASRGEDGRRVHRLRQGQPG